MPFITGAAIIGSSLLGANAAEEAGDVQAQAADQSLRLQRETLNRTREDLQPWQRAGRVSLSDLSTLLGMQGGNVEQDPRYQKILDDMIAGQDAQHSRDFGASIFASPEWSRVRGNLERQARQQFMSQFPDFANENRSDPRFGMLTRPFGMQDFQESPAYQFNLQQGQKAIEKAAASRGMFYAPQTLQDISKFSQGMASNEFQNSLGNFYGFQDRLFNRLYSMSGSGQNAANQMGAFGSNAAGQMGDAITGGAAARAAGGVGAANAISGGVGMGTNAFLMNQFLQGNQRPSVSLGSIPSMTGSNDLMAFA
jgi:hypothetical protein